MVFHTEYHRATMAMAGEMLLTLDDMVSKSLSTSCSSEPKVKEFENTASNKKKMLVKSWPMKMIR